MELKLKSLCLLCVIFLLMAVLPNDGLRVSKKKFRFIKIRPTRRPPITNSSIPKEKCKIIVNGPPKRFVGRFIKGPICVLLNESQKTARLQKVGGYVPRYVAVNKKEALQFESLLGDVQPLPTRPPSSSPYNNQSDLSSIFGQQDGTAGNRKRRSSITLPSSPGTTVIQECFDGGSLLEDDGFRRLCTECFGISQLPEGVFPPFINEVICGDDSDFCVPGIGECQQRVIKLNVLNFTGEFERDDDLSEVFGFDVFVEELETIEVELRACCECRLFAFLGKK